MYHMAGQSYCQFMLRLYYMEWLGTTIPNLCKSMLYGIIGHNHSPPLEDYLVYYLTVHTQSLVVARIYYMVWLNAAILSLLKKLLYGVAEHNHSSPLGEYLSCCLVVHSQPPTVATNLLYQLVGCNHSQSM